MEFSRPEYWSGSTFPSPGNLPNPGIKPRSPALQEDFLPAQSQAQSQCLLVNVSPNALFLFQNPVQESHIACSCCVSWISKLQIFWGILVISILSREWGKVIWYEKDPHSKFHLRLDQGCSICSAYHKTSNLPVVTTQIPEDQFRPSKWASLEVDLRNLHCNSFPSGFINIKICNLKGGMYREGRKEIVLTICTYACSFTQLCPTLWDPMDCRPPGSSVHGISQARILEWVAISSSRGSSRPRDQTHVSCLAGRFFTTELPGKPRWDSNLPKSSLSEVGGYVQPSLQES